MPLDEEQLPYTPSGSGAQIYEQSNDVTFPWVQRPGNMRPTAILWTIVWNGLSTWHRVPSSSRGRRIDDERV